MYIKKVKLFVLGGLVFFTITSSCPLYDLLPGAGILAEKMTLQDEVKGQAQGWDVSNPNLWVQIKPQPEPEIIFISDVGQEGWYARCNCFFRVSNSMFWLDMACGESKSSMRLNLWSDAGWCNLLGAYSLAPFAKYRLTWKRAMTKEDFQPAIDAIMKIAEKFANK